MATIGHSLVGLSFAGMSRASARNNALRYVWPGFMILMGHIVDIIEWFTVVFFSNWADGHYLTHSPYVTAGFLLIICLIVAAAARLRKPWPYVLIAACVLSHLVLDARWGRKTLADAYGVMPEGLDGYSLIETIVAEIWFYGLLLLVVMLSRGAGKRACPRLGRIAAGVLGTLAIVAAGTRMPALWAPVYALGFLHASLLLRREFNWRLAWGALFLIPLLLCVVSEIHASNLGRDAWQHLLDKDYRRTIALYEKALAFPQRASPVMTLVRIGQCYEYLGELPQAEMYFKRAVAASEEPGWGQYWLAWFYANQNWQATPYYRPAEATKILEELSKLSDRPSVKEQADGLLAILRAR